MRWKADGTAWTKLHGPLSSPFSHTHAAHEQFHSEIKTDLDLERLPSGKFASNDLILHLAQLAYNILSCGGSSA